MYAIRIISGILMFSLFVGCASSNNSQPSGDWGDNFSQNLHNAGAQAGAGSREGVEDQDAAARCEFALETEERLVEMKEKADSTTAGDVLLSANSNYWALVPIPGASLMNLRKNRSNELGIWNKDGCWSKSCVDEKLALSREAVATYCPAGAYGEI